MATQFPPSGPTGLLTAIPSYLYQQYTDDDDLQALVRAQNNYQQIYVDAFNNLNLPIYTQPQISGYLLDWVGSGIYGYARPALGAVLYTVLGPLDTAYCNEIYMNEFKKIVKSGKITIADDDIYKRCLTWHFYKGDGKYFNVRWLKRRVARFIYGVNGTDPISDTVSMYQISISFGANREVTIRFVLLIQTLEYGAVCNDYKFYCNNLYCNQVNIGLKNLPPLPSMETFRDAVASGALELPFQYSWQVQIG